MDASAEVVAELEQAVDGALAYAERFDPEFVECAAFDLMDLLGMPQVVEYAAQRCADIALPFALLGVEEAPTLVADYFAERLADAVKRIVDGAV